MTLGTIITIFVGLLFLATYKYFYNAPSRALEAHDKRLDGMFGCFSVLRRIDQDQQAEISGRLRGGQTVPQELVLRSPLGDVYSTIHEYIFISLSSLPLRRLALTSCEDVSRQRPNATS